MRGSRSRATHSPAAPTAGLKRSAATRSLLRWLLRLRHCRRCLGVQMGSPDRARMRASPRAAADTATGSASAGLGRSGPWPAVMQLCWMASTGCSAAPRAAATRRLGSRAAQGLRRRGSGEVSGAVAVSRPGRLRRRWDGEGTGTSEEELGSSRRGQPGHQRRSPEALTQCDWRTRARPGQGRMVRAAAAAAGTGSLWVVDSGPASARRNG